MVIYYIVVLLVCVTIVTMCALEYMEKQNS